MNAPQSDRIPSPRPPSGKPPSGKIAAAAAIWALGIFLSRFVGLFRERALGATVGITGEADVYQAAFGIPDFLSYLLAGGALSIVFIPLVSEHLEKGDEARSWYVFSIVANFLVLLMAILVPLCFLLMPWLVPLYAPGFDAEKSAHLVHLSRIVLPGMAFHLVGALLNAALLARDHHGIPALSPLLYNLSIIAGGVLLGSAEGFAWGVLFGAFLAAFLVPLLSCLRVGLHWRPVLDFKDPDFRRFFLATLPIMLGQSIVGLDDKVTTFFASNLKEGEVALLAYARTLMKVPMSIFGVAMGYAAYPTLSRLCIEGRPGEAYRMLSVATRRVLLLAFGSQVVVTVAGPELATMVYGTARISPESLERMGFYLGIFSLALGAWSANTLLARGFYARGRTWVPTWLGTGVLLLSLPLYWGLSGSAAGLALASSIAMVAYVVLLQLQLQREIGEGPGYFPFLLRAFPPVVVAIAVGLGLRRLWPGSEATFFAALLRTVVFAGISGTIYLLLSWLFGVQELKDIFGMVRRRLGRRG